MSNTVCILSLSSKALLVHSGGGNESPMEEGSGLRQDCVDGERQRDSESKETDADGTAGAAEIIHHHRGSADKHKFNTLGYQASDRDRNAAEHIQSNAV